MAYSGMSLWQMERDRYRIIVLVPITNQSKGRPEIRMRH